ncbi:MAG: gas vesicle protein GvpG [Proteobacteria bacterium]|nr:gas vesicle protein GvpG [Pseudomonadota bacterium]MBU4354922.1 gas vesicle protein GvpG [Pseudomonadota bacterium]MBU4448400.1 gas vesicle protein GvpG [Pseudomonadota bacterium]
MFIIDDVLLSPIKGILWVFQEIHDAAREDQAGEGDRITGQLSELYMKLETGQITEAEFDAQEKTLLDHLDRIQETAAPIVSEKKLKKAGKKAPGGKKLSTGRARSKRG